MISKLLLGIRAGGIPSKFQYHIFSQPWALVRRASPEPVGGFTLSPPKGLTNILNSFIVSSRGFISPQKKL